MTVLGQTHITAEISNLEIANNAFIAAYTRRSEERAVNAGMTAVLRQQMFDLYMSMCYQLQYLANSTLTANASKAAACQPFIATLNSVLADVKKRYNQRINALHQGDEGGSGNASENGTGGTPAGNDTPAGGNDTPAGGNDNPAGGNDTPAGGNDQPAGNDGNDTPGSSQPDGGPDPTVTDENAEF